MHNVFNSGQTLNSLGQLLEHADGQVSSPEILIELGWVGPG